MIKICCLRAGLLLLAVCQLAPVQAEEFIGGYYKRKAKPESVKIDEHPLLRPIQQYPIVRFIPTGLPAPSGGPYWAPGGDLVSGMRVGSPYYNQVQDNGYPYGGTYSGGIATAGATGPAFDAGYCAGTGFGSAGACGCNTGSCGLATQCGCAVRRRCGCSLAGHVATPYTGCGCGGGVAFGGHSGYAAAGYHGHVGHHGQAGFAGHGCSTCGGVGGGSGVAGPHLAQGVWSSYRPNHWTYAGAGSSDPYDYHYGPGFHRNQDHAHYRFPWDSYRRPWYFPGHPSYSRDTNYPW